MPAGLTFDVRTHAFTGTPTALAARRIYTYTATDSDGDTAVLTFNITVAEDPTVHFSEGLRLDPQEYVQNSAITPLTLPEATGGKAPFRYSIVAFKAPASGGFVLLDDLIGLSFDPDTRVLSGTPTTQGFFSFTYTATDADGDTGEALMAVKVADTSPDFGSETIPDQNYVQNMVITTLQLPGDVSTQSLNVPFLYSL